MINGSILAGDEPLGSGFGLADRIVATAAHVVRNWGPADLAFVTDSGVRIPVEKVDLAPRIDAALLRVTTSLAMLPPLAYAKPRSQWCATCRLDGAAVQLTGEVSAVDHLIDDKNVLQLEVKQDIKDFHGYSGGAVVVDGAVVGILVEQVFERIPRMPGARKLAANVLYAVPLDRVFAAFKLNRSLMRRPDTRTAPYQLVDTAYFDLEPLKTSILKAKAEAENRVLAFGVDSMDLEVANNLSAWLRFHIENAEQRGQLTLRPEVVSVDKMIMYLTRYVANLDEVSIVCTVCVGGTPTPLVAELWDQVRHAYGSPKQWFVVFFVGVPLGGYPPAVTSLPQVTFASGDVNAWTRQVAGHCKWPSWLADVWSNDIVKQASPDDGLDIRLTYEVLESCINELRSDPAKLRQALEDLEVSC